MKFVAFFAYSRYTISDTNQEIKSICQEPIVFLLKNKEKTNLYIIR